MTTAIVFDAQMKALYDYLGTGAVPRGAALMCEVGVESAVSLSDVPAFG